jgi:hypothetical protein
MSSKTRLKTTNERSRQFLLSWRDFAPEASLAGSTLTQFEIECQEPNELQLEIEASMTHHRGLIIHRDEAEARLQTKLKALANAVRCDPNHGMNSAFYRSLGFIVDRERKRPTRKSMPAETPPAANVA